METEDTLDLERKYIERAAVELCWLTRPAHIDPGENGPNDWWRMQPETERNRHILRARVAIEVWEKCHA